MELGTLVILFDSPVIPLHLCYKSVTWGKSADLSIVFSQKREICFYHPSDWLKMKWQQQLIVLKPTAQLCWIYKAAVSCSPNAPRLGGVKMGIWWRASWVCEWVAFHTPTTHHHHINITSPQHPPMHYPRDNPYTYTWKDPCTAQLACHVTKFPF